MSDDDKHGWNHLQCDRCWERYEGDRTACRIRDEYRELGRCCYCGTLTRSGIYRRVRPGSPAIPYCADTSDE